MDATDIPLTAPARTVLPGERRLRATRRRAGAATSDNKTASRSLRTHARVCDHSCPFRNLVANASGEIFRTGVVGLDALTRQLFDDIAVPQSFVELPAHARKYRLRRTRCRHDSVPKRRFITRHACF